MWAFGKEFIAILRERAPEVRRTRRRGVLHLVGASER